MGFGCGLVKGGQLLGGQSHGNDLRWQRSAARPASTSSLELLHVVARLGFRNPALDLFRSHHAKIV